MKAVLIAEGGAFDVEVEANLESLYENMDCTTITSAGAPADNHVCYADDEAWFKAGSTIMTQVSWWPEPLIGKLLIKGVDEHGEPRDSDLTAADVTKLIENQTAIVVRP